MTHYHSGTNKYPFISLILTQCEYPRYIAIQFILQLSTVLQFQFYINLFLKYFSYELENYCIIILK